MALAESCTGGLLGAAITAEPGVSSWFRGAMVVYHNDLKTEWLGISEELLQRDGAVSRSCALEMARAVRHKAEATLGVGLTGIAGPSGATPDKPVGLVFLALSTENREDCLELRLSGDRGDIREAAVTQALQAISRF